MYFLFFFIQRRTGTLICCVNGNYLDFFAFVAGLALSYLLPIGCEIKKKSKRERERKQVYVRGGR